MKSIILHILFAAMTALGGPAFAQSFPNKPIKLIVPWPPGGATDSIARMVAAQLGERLGQSVVVENIPGAGGNIGTGKFVRTKPDGYTLLMATSSTNAASPYLYTKLDFDPVKDFAPVIFTTLVPNVLIVPINSPLQTVRQLVDAAKASPGTLTYGSAGVGASQHLAGAQLSQVAGIDLVHVPYKGGAPAMQDLMGGRLTFIVNTGALPYVKSGRMRALAVASEKRLSSLPDVPTFEEAGIKNMVASAWHGIVAPAGTPPEIVNQLNRELNVVLKSPEMRKLLTEFGAEIGGGTPEEFGRFMHSELTRYAEIVRLSGAKLD
jgi:tripartite-type tricarboxylate transporter receptor subunit TctC